ncbi:RsmB/NOP family class I SAM-dependent RNA methyltransferase [Spirosoma sp. RP8]|uniref:RsmB/NOP family class I SAM-dependent RNA methyltransferase n=1 Tax=Spirosoma liriopis TaxID=2937440 RepID=A0ABT0HW33_9BACT|nr:RsmB/NOP family class I SAM-dependent RNA methyltransferase [Spirosoma liriopis]MCK8495725.1 RsmB/NOP family class I SAM-dependent RNA methyltransferase [Spirosoma liriopis]
MNNYNPLLAGSASSELPSAFQAQMQAQLGTEFSAFESAIKQETPVSIRINPRKQQYDTTGLDRVPWCSEGFYLNERPSFTLDPLFQAGAYYVQEASSMLLQEALKQTANLNRPLRVLDLCAAPGGKSTLLASALHPDSLLICNEVIRSRVSVLRENLDKWGYANVVVSNHDPEDMGNLAGFFDVVVVDAPCSGEGLFRKDPDAMNEWSEDAVQLCSARQKRILSAAAPLLDEGGILIYSTCTYNDSENSENVRYLTQHGFRNRALTLPAEWNVAERWSDNTVGYQCYPHRVRGEGFFISVFQKTAFTAAVKLDARTFRSIRTLRPRETASAMTWLQNPANFSLWEKPNGDVMALPKALEKQFLFLDSALRNKGFGLEIGQFKGTDFIPSHALALSTIINQNLPALSLSKEEALRYFKKENLVFDQPVKGWQLAQYEGINLGWVKGVGNRVNNYLPKDWRIRMDIKEYI